MIEIDGKFAILLAGCGENFQGIIDAVMAHMLGLDEE
jgi:hypothetical protein